MLNVTVTNIHEFLDSFAAKASVQIVFGSFRDIRVWNGQSRTAYTVSLSGGVINKLIHSNSRTRRFGEPDEPIHKKIWLKRMIRSHKAKLLYTNMRVNDKMFIIGPQQISIISSSSQTCVCHMQPQ